MNQYHFFSKTSNFLTGNFMSGFEVVTPSSIDPSMKLVGPFDDRNVYSKIEAKFSGSVFTVFTETCRNNGSDIDPEESVPLFSSVIYGENAIIASAERSGFNYVMEPKSVSSLKKGDIVISFPAYISSYGEKISDRVLYFEKKYKCVVSRVSTVITKKIIDSPAFQIKMAHGSVVLDGLSLLV